MGQAEVVTGVGSRRYRIQGGSPIHQFLSSAEEDVPLHCYEKLCISLTPEITVRRTLTAASTSALLHP